LIRRGFLPEKYFRFRLKTVSHSNEVPTWPVDVTQSSSFEKGVTALSVLRPADLNVFEKMHKVIPCLLLCRLMTAYLQSFEGFRDTQSCNDFFASEYRFPGSLYAEEIV
jgi:hypothetical protein